MFAAVALIADQFRLHVHLQRCGVVPGPGQMRDIPASQALQAQVANGGIDLQRVPIRLGQGRVVLLESAVLCGSQAVLLGVK